MLLYNWTDYELMYLEKKPSEFNLLLFLIKLMFLEFVEKTGYDFMPVLPLVLGLESWTPLSSTI